MFRAPGEVRRPCRPPACADHPVVITPGSKTPGVEAFSQIVEVIPGKFPAGFDRICRATARSSKLAGFLVRTARSGTFIEKTQEQYSERPRGIDPAVEGGMRKYPSPARPNPLPGSDSDIGLAEHVIEHLPACDPGGIGHPDVGGVAPPNTVSPASRAAAASSAALSR